MDKLIEFNGYNNEPVSIVIDKIIGLTPLEYGTNVICISTEGLFVNEPYEQVRRKIEQAMES